MSSADTEQARGTLWQRRAVVVLAAVAAAVVVWVVAQAFDINLRSPSSGSRGGDSIGIGPVLMVSAFASLVGWGLLALLERLTPRAGTVWTVVAGVVFLLSLGGPWSGDGVDTGVRLTLTTMHVVVAAILITQLPRRATRHG
jgi:hypothetical protein